MKKLSQLLVGLLLVAVTAFGFTACERVTQSEKESIPDPVYSIDLSADKTTALRGDEIVLTATVLCDGEVLEDASVIVGGDDVLPTFAIVEGEEHVSLDGNVLTVLDTAPDGLAIKAQATLGEYTSNVVSIVVSVPVTAISVSTNGVTNVLAGNSIILSKTVTPADANVSGMAWVITEGSDLCAISGDVLIVNQNAETGSAIKVKAVCGDVESEEVSLIVGVPVESISIRVIGSTEVVKGNTAQLSMSVSPASASEKSVSWVLTQDGDYAEMIEKTLYVKSTAPTGAIIKVKAVCGDVESEEISFTVMPTQHEINASNYNMSFTSDSIKVDKNSASNPVLGVEIFDDNFDDVFDVEVVFEIVSGEEFVDMIVDGYTCSFTPVAHGETVVRATIVGTDEVVEATVFSVVPPDVVKLPEVFAERVGFAYNFAKENILTKEVYTLPFVPYVDQDGVCTDLVLSFTHEDTTSGDAVATYDYEKGEITFHKLGRITVTATSDSGSRKETSVSYTFNVNEGFNVHTFEEAADLTQSNSYVGQVINFVVLVKPDGSAAGIEYGYDLVPTVALKPIAEQTPEEAIKQSRKVRIIAVNKSLYINGNRHTIDGSNVRTFSEEEVDAYNDKYGSTFKLHGGILSAEPWMKDASDVKGTFQVNVYDLTIKGNCPLDYDKATETWSAGCYQVGLNVGQVEYSAQYYVDIKNVTVTQFYQGVALKSVVGNGTVENIEVSNIYATGIVLKSSIVTLKNIKLGPCGAVGVELVPDDSAKAGVNENENQTVTFAGELDVLGNLMTGDTKYFNYYIVMGYKVPDIIKATIAGIGDNNKIGHVMNGEGKFVLVTFMLSSFATGIPNTSVALYPEYQAGGIIDAADLPASGYDTTHEFVRVKIDMGGMNLGSALMYNLHYGETV